MTAENQTPAAQEKETITIEDFMKVELRVGKIMACEKAPKSRKLLRMDVDLGGEVRQILAGIAPYYLPQELIGRRVAVVANLKPAKLMGLESQGMLLAASTDHQEAVTLVSVPEGMPLGSRIR